MVLSLALAEMAVSWLILLGLIVVIFANLWTLVVAAKRSVLWLIAILLLPVAGLILLLVEPKARVPFLVAVLGLGMVLGGVFAADPGMSQDETFVDQILRPLQRLVGAEGTIEERKDRIRARQAQLESKKAALKPGDTAARADFDEELQRYVDDLERLKRDIAAQPKP